MNLGQIKSRVKNLLNYSPENDEFEAELLELVNDAFGTLAMEAEWPFMGREIDRTLHGRVTDSAGTATSGTFNVTTAAAFFLPWMIGHRITIGTTIYNIVRVASTTSAYLDAPFAGTTGTYQFTVDEVFPWLPEDCNYVIEIGSVLRQNATQHGTFTPMMRAEAGRFALNDDTTGTPAMWMMADSVSIPTPRVGPVMSAVAGVNWVGGTYDFALSYSRAGYHGSLSPVTSQLVTALQNPRLTLVALDAHVGYQRNLWTRVSATAPWRLFDSELDESAHTRTYNTPLSASSEFEVVNNRFPNTDGQVQRVRIYPLAGADTLVRIRYMRRFTKLVEDTDVPAFFPAQAHDMVAYRVAELLAQKLGQDATEKFCRGKAKDYMNSLCAKYLTPSNRIIVKGNAWASAQQRWNYGPVTWT